MRSKWVLLVLFFIGWLSASGCALTTEESESEPARRVVILSRRLYINTEENGGVGFEGVTWEWLDTSRQKRVLVMEAGDKVVLDSVKIERGGLLSGYTTFKCRPLERPSIRFDFVAGVDGKIDDSRLPW